MKRLALTVLAALLLCSASAHASLVAHWGFEETAGTTISDSARPGMPGTLVPGAGSPNLNVPGQFGSGLFLSNSGDYVSVPRVEINNTSFTVGAWVNPSSLANGDEIFGDWSNPWQFRLYLNSNGSVTGNARKNTVAVSDLFSFSTPAGAVTTGNWTHVAWTWDTTSQQSKLYINGVESATTPVIAPPLDFKNGNHANYQIGNKFDDGNTYHGSIDEVSFFDEALNVAQINNLKNLNDAFTPQLPLMSPAVATGNLRFNTLVTNNDGTSFTSAPLVVTDFVSGESATIQITMTSLSGDQFLKLDSNTRLGVGNSNGGPDGFHVDIGNSNGDTNPLAEDVQFIVTLLSKSAGVGDVGFNITALGLRSTGSPSVEWNSDASGGPIVLSFSGEANRAMDPAMLFHLLTMSDYTGVLEVTANQFQFTDTGGASGISFSVQLNPVATPEPATMSLALLGLAALLRRRRHGRAA